MRDASLLPLGRHHPQRRFCWDGVDVVKERRRP
jgi:hypothetical protein